MRSHVIQPQTTEETVMTIAIESHELASHTRYLIAYALRKVSDRALAEDLVQDTLLAALSPEGRFEGRSSVRTWLTGILKHKILDSFRARARVPMSLDDVREDGEEPIEAAIARGTEQFDFGGDPQKQLEHKRFWEAFQRELKRMPARTAQAFVLSEFTARPTEEVCEEMGVSPGSLWVMRCRARNALRAALAPAMAA